jgi:hypothetical protein
MKKGKYSFFSDIYTAIVMALLTLMAWYALGLMIVWGIVDPPTIAEFFPQLFLFLLALFGSVFFTMMLSRSTEIIELTEDGVTIKRLYKKSVHKSYKEYPFFKIGYYTEFGMPRYFLVMCSHYISPEEVCHINMISSSEDCIKIKISSGRCRKLMKIFPEDLAKKLKDNMTPDGKFYFDAKAYLKRQQMRKKKKK